MSEMVERVARAIFDTAVGPDKWDNEFWAEERAGCFTSARAAIEAMREPTPEMQAAGKLPAEDGGAIACWCAMIEAALDTRS